MTGFKSSFKWEKSKKSNKLFKKGVKSKSTKKLVLKNNNN